MPLRQKVQRFEMTVDGVTGPYSFTMELPIGAAILSGELMRCVGFVRVIVDAIIVIGASLETRKFVVMERDDEIDEVDGEYGSFECQLRVLRGVVNVDDPNETAYLFAIEAEEPSNG